MWDVKVYHISMTLRNLYRTARKIEAVPQLTFRQLRKAANELTDIGAERLYSMAQEDARDQVAPPARMDPVMFNTLWNGSHLDVTFEFMGSGGGWLTLTRFHSWTMVDDVSILEEMPFKDLRALCELVWEVDGFVNRSGPTRTIEECAAHILFVSLCDF